MFIANDISQKNNVPLNEIMFLRHAKKNITRLKKFEAKINEYTTLQPINSEYDFHRCQRNTNDNKIVLLVVIVNDSIDGVYRVDAETSSGTRYDLASTEARNYYAEAKIEEKKANWENERCRRFKITKIPDSHTYEGLAVTGWSNKRAMTQRANDRFFCKIEGISVSG
jgi:hypothetical protein